MHTDTTDGGGLLADILQRHGIDCIFTLCGGHISPILVGCKRRGIRVVDVRHEASAVFAADALARLTGRPGVAAVTAGPGLTNAVTALQNARMAGSPLVLLGGAPATLLRGRGALQDIDALSVMRPVVKRAAAAGSVREMARGLEEALREAQSGLPGPVFLECPIDLLYPQTVVREWYRKEAGRGIAGALAGLYLKRHADRVFAGADDLEPGEPTSVPPGDPRRADVRRAAGLLRGARRPVLVVGSQALLHAGEAARVAQAVRALGLPTFLAGMARGLLGAQDPLLLRHRRREALREADVVLLAGIPCDFRLGYGRHLHRRAAVISVQRGADPLARNRKPTLGVDADPGRFLQALAGAPGKGGEAWRCALRQREEQREAEIAEQAAERGAGVNPLHLCREIDAQMAADSVVVVDGGDFAATAAYTVRPRGPLCWLDPGVFGTLGVGGGFAMGAAHARPDAEIWLIYGDGAAAYSLAEFDTFVRHRMPVIAVVGNDAAWSQIAREQVKVLGDPVGTRLLPTDYHRVAEGYGGAGFLLERSEDAADVLAQARSRARGGGPVLVNARLGASAFREGSISV